MSEEYGKKKIKKQIADNMQTYKIDLIGNTRTPFKRNRSDRNKKYRHQGYV